MPVRTCRYCGRPIYKFLVGWLHKNEGLPGVPMTLHAARPYLPGGRL